MLSSFLWMLLVLISTRAEQVQFPAKCPSQNLADICSKLGQIGNDKVLVFADGTQMPACYLRTTSVTTRAEDQRQEDELFRALYQPLKKMLYPNREPNKLETESIFFQMDRIKSHILQSNDLNKVYDISPTMAFSEKIKAYIKYKEQTRPPRALREIDVTADVNFAKQHVTGLFTSITTEAQRKNLADFANDVRITTAGQVKSEKHIPCKPSIGAFFMSEPYQITMNGVTTNGKMNSITMTPAYSRLPAASRIFVFGHELGHAFDPCSFQLKEQHPFFKLIDCVQNQVGYFKKNYSTDQCDEHTREAFCDQIGVSAMEEWVKTPKDPVQLPEAKPNLIFMPAGYEYLIYHLDQACEFSSSDRQHTHPASDRRLNDILMKSPIIAKTVGCPVDPETHRCDVKLGEVGKQPAFYKRWFERGKLFIR